MPGRILFPVSGLLTTLALTGCMPEHTYASDARAWAELDARDAAAMKGKASFVQRGLDVTVTLRVLGATPGVHPAHVRDGCASGPAPADVDLGALAVAADGTGTLEV